MFSCLLDWKYCVNGYFVGMQVFMLEGGHYDSASTSDWRAALTLGERSLLKWIFLEVIQNHFLGVGLSNLWELLFQWFTSATQKTPEVGSASAELRRHLWRCVCKSGDASASLEMRLQVWSCVGNSGDASASLEMRPQVWSWVGNSNSGVELAILVFPNEPLACWSKWKFMSLRALMQP